MNEHLLTVPAATDLTRFREKYCDVAVLRGDAGTVRVSVLTPDPIEKVCESLREATAVWTCSSEGKRKKGTRCETATWLAAMPSIRTEVPDGKGGMTVSVTRPTAPRVDHVWLGFPTPTPDTEEDNPISPIGGKEP
jgi:hypothetical protein